MPRILILAIGAMMLTAATPAMAGDLIVTVTGIRGKSGKILVAVFDRATFLRATAPFGGSADADTKGDIVVTIKDIPAGDYAVSVLHDQDGSGTMTIGANNRSTEGAGISRGDRLRAAPTFNTTRIAVPDAGAKVQIGLTYPEDF